jgi:hypothetical protein
MSKLGRVGSCLVASIFIFVFVVASGMNEAGARGFGGHGGGGFRAGGGHFGGGSFRGMGGGGLRSGMGGLNRNFAVLVVNGTVILVLSLHQTISYFSKLRFAKLHTD